MVRLTRGLVWWTGALFLGAIVAATISFFQLKATQGQLQEMRSSSADSHNLVDATQQPVEKSQRLAVAIDNLRAAAFAFQAGSDPSPRGA
jgi:hypothetical protein